MVAHKLCAFPGCKSDTRYNYKTHMIGVTFRTFPKPKTKPIQCSQWVSWLKNYRPGFKVEHVKKGTYICSNHNFCFDEFFRNRPTPIPHPEALPIPVLTITVRPPQVSLLKNNTKGEAESPIKSNCGVSNHSKIATCTPCISADVLMETKIMDGDMIIPHALDITNSYVTEAEVVIEKSKPAEIESTSDNITDSFDITNSYVAETEIAIAKSKTAEIISTIAEQSIKAEIMPDKDDIPHVFDITNSNVSVDEEAALESLKSLIDTFGQFPVPPDWGLSLTTESLKLFKIDFDRGFVLFSILLDCNFNLSLKILNKPMNDHPLLTNLPSKIFSIEELGKLLDNFQKFRICDGIKEARYKELFKESVREDSFMCWHTDAIRHASCGIISQVKRCGNCAKFRTNLRAHISNRRKSRTGARKVFKTMSKETLVEELKQAKAIIHGLNKKLKRKQRNKGVEEVSE